MTGSDSLRSASSDAGPPTTCPTCGSSSIVTTAKKPDADSYWRCESCGDVWNAARTRKSWQDGRRWR